MIKLSLNTDNIVVMTLKENNTSGGDSYYLIEFISDDTDVSKLFTAVDISTNIDRYNQFVITLTTGIEDLLTGTVSLPTEGYYTYNVYSQTSETTTKISEGA